MCWGAVKEQLLGYSCSQRLCHWSCSSLPCQGSVRSGLACLGQVIPVWFGVSHPLAGAVMPALVCWNPHELAGSGLHGQAFPRPWDTTPSPLGPGHAVSQGRWRRTKPSR